MAATTTTRLFDGTSMAYTFADPDAPTRWRIQYWENNGHRALWSDGWLAIRSRLLAEEWHPLSRS